MEGCINLKQALQIIETKDVEGFPISFNLEFRTLNRNSKTGGALRSYTSVSVLTSREKQVFSDKEIVKNLQLANRTRRNPNHFLNRTRNLQKPNGEIFKVNIRLIDSINNQKVVY
jgi:hypothetical protein